MMYCERTTRYMWSGDMWEGGEGDNCFPRPCTAQHSLPWPGVGRTFGQDAVDAGCAVKISAIVTTFHHLQACSNTKEMNKYFCSLTQGYKIWTLACNGSSSYYCLLFIVSYASLSKIQQEFICKPHAVLGQGVLIFQTTASNYMNEDIDHSFLVPSACIRSHSCFSSEFSFELPLGNIRTFFKCHLFWSQGVSQLQGDGGEVKVLYMVLSEYHL